MRRWPCIAAAPGAAFVLVDTAVALALGNSSVFVPLLVIGPLVAAALAAPRCTVGVALLALACAIPLGLADHQFLSAEHIGEVVAVAAGGVLAVLAAKGRRSYEDALVNERAARRRSEFIARAGELLDAPPEPEAMLREIVRMAVPDLAELCIVDLVHDGALGETTAYATKPRTLEMLHASRTHYPLDPQGPHPVAVVARTGRPHLQHEIGAERLRAFAVDERHLKLMTGAGYATSLSVPLVARGRTIGVLSFMRFGGSAPYADDDVELAVEVARRAALALDNARLFAELRRTEGQLEAVLANLATAVTVQAPDGSLVYVNQAAAKVLGCESPEEALSTPLAELVDAFVVLDEDGRPFDLRDLPGRRALAGEESRPTLTQSVTKATGEVRWSVTKATPVRDEHGAVALAVNIIEDVTDARLAERQQRFLSAASKLVSSSLDIDVTLDKVAGAPVPELADWCCVDVPDERGVVRRAALGAGDADREALERMREAMSMDPDDPGSPAHVLRTGRGVVIADFDDAAARAWAGGDEEGAAALRASGTRSAMVVPMAAGDRAIGVVTLGTSHSARRLGEAELELAVELGRRAGIAVENARLHAARSSIATTLQRSLLPPRLPIVPGVTIAARFRAAGETSEVGGDFYDVFGVGDGWMVVVGDVTGKGPAAATITSLARYTMRTAAMYERSPAAVLARLNAALAADPDRRQICTAACARIEPAEDGTLRVALALGGHPPPFLISAAGGADTAGAPGPLLGAFDGGAWGERHFVVGAGDALVFYTDGVTDTRGEDGELFGQERLYELLDGAAALDADEVASRIDDALQAFEHGQQRDDVALLVLRAGAGGDAPLAGVRALSGIRTAGRRPRP
jgi:PAS domain S-box-containing protein